MVHHKWINGLLSVSTCLLLAFQGNLPNLRKNDTSPSGWQLLGQFGGPVQGIASDKGYVYVGVGPRMVSLDARTPADMHPIGGSDRFDDFVQAVAVSGNNAYVAAGSAGLRIMDISDPAKPTETGAYNSPGFAKGVVISGQIAYLADGPYGLAIIDISDPKKPLAVAAAYATEFAYGLALSGQYLYMAAGSAGVLVVDVTDPAHPIESGRLDTPGYAYGLTAAESALYVADGWNGLQVVNITNPTAPMLGSQFSTPGWAFGAAISGTQVFVADAQAGMRLVNVTDPAIPAELGSFDENLNQTSGVVIAGNIAFISDRNGGVRAVDVSNPANIIQVAEYIPIGNAARVVVVDQYAFVAAGNYGLRILDVSDLTHPLEVGIYDSQGYAVGVQVIGNYAYIAHQFYFSGNCGMDIVDISDPTKPVFMSRYLSTTNGASRDIEVVDNIAYVVDEMSLQLIDVSDPQKPSMISRLVLNVAEGDEAVGISVADGVAFIASSAAGLRTVDVSDSSNPVLLSQSTTQWSQAEDVTVVGNIAYMAEYNILRMIDVSDPANLKELGLVFTSGVLYDVKVVENTAYMAISGSGLETADISNPANIVLTGTFDTKGIAHGLAINGDNIFLADGQNGLVILSPASGTTAMKSDSAMAEVENTSSNTTLSLPTFDAVYSQVRFSSNGSKKTMSQGAKPEISGSGYPAIRGITCTVTSAENSGYGTLRECLEDIVKDTTINFSPDVFPPTNPVTISILSQLPHFPGNVTIDASNAGVILDGSMLQRGESGLGLTSDGNTVKGLQLIGFPDHAIIIMGRDNIIGGDRSKGAGPLGEGNLISGNRDIGIFVASPDATGNQIVGNLIGTDVSGKSALGNGNHGIFIHGGAHDNMVGGPEEWQRNIVCDNFYAGISMMGQGTSHNLIIGNYVGTDITGTIDLGNRGNGITMELAASANTVQGNLSSGNTDVGIGIADQESDYNIIIGNLVGTDASGTKAIPNDDGGIRAGFGGASFNRIGGTEPGEGNLVSGNFNGISVSGANSVGFLVLGNYIGTDVSGEKALGNQTDGLLILASETIAAGNIVAGNSGDGISVRPGSTPSFVLDNFVGTDRSGTVQLGNDGPGIAVQNSQTNFIQGNLVAFNLGEGVKVNEGQQNSIRRNGIFSNEGDGILSDGAGNAQLAAPALAADLTQAISGTACAGCIIELFADAGNQGKYYLDSRAANQDGTFNFALPCLPVGLKITATATDPTGNTSQFSTPGTVSWTCDSLIILAQ